MTRMLWSKMWDELVRRRVVRTGAVYAFASFVTLQLGEILLPAYEVGPEGLRVLVAALMAALPFVLAASWIFDVTAPAVRRAPRESGGRGSGDGRGVSNRAIAAVIVSAAALGWAGWWLVGGSPGWAASVSTLPSLLAAAAVLSVAGWRSLSDPPAEGAAGPRIAVLPFVCWGSEPDDHLGEMLADQIRDELQQESGVEVAARISCSDRAALHDARLLGRRLGVGLLLEGSVLRRGPRARVTAQLIDATSGFRVWSKTYALEPDAGVTSQDRIVSAVVEAIVGRPDDTRPLRAV